MHGGNRDWAAHLSGCSPREILDFSASINPLGPSQSVIECIQSQIGVLQAYPDPNYVALCSSLGAAHTIDPDWILPGNGSAELLTWVCRDLSQLQVDIFTPGFGDYIRALNAFSAQFCVHTLQPWHQSATNIADQSTSLVFSNWLTRVSVLDLVPTLDFCSAPTGRGLLINNPHNPTGVLWSRESILNCLNAFELVVVDEAFMDFLPPQQQQSLIGDVTHHPNLVILRSLTKFYSLPALRLGYAIAHPDRLQRWQRWRDPWPVNSLAAEAGITALQDHVFQHKTREWMATAQPSLYQGLAQTTRLDPLASDVNFFLVRSPQMSVPELQLRLLQRHRILIRDCLSFPELGDRYFRVAVRTEIENQRLLTALTAELSA